ncbi:tyrosine kinase-like protein [Plasmodium gonderi]|uniref:Tyrosine kinase-like protein n=1 Tax=Plasmodium gonderi TaxID=77519 RepID=A0A1Y1JEM6_PLAGO|nr:tyrosine kinase-like protein [Plasmodium gonderi]GAW80981.1 tyrosine kinase-like protein [Plasmodium gonderi]
MNKKILPIRETNIEKGAIDIFKQKIERKKQNYLRFSFSKNLQNKRGESRKNEENNTSPKNKKLIYIETCDTHDKYILNMYDEENESCEKGACVEGEKYDSVYKKNESKNTSKNEENIYIPLKILSNRYDYNDIVQATNNFAEENKIAKGGNGIVYKGVLKSCINVAIKVLSKNENNGFENEIIIMSRYRHKNILSLLGYAMDTNYFYLIYEYVHLGDLRTLLFNHHYFYNSKDRENTDANYSSNMKKYYDHNFISKQKFSPYSNNYLLTNKQMNPENGNNNLRYSYFTQDYFESQNMPIFLSFRVRLNILVQIINVLCYLHTSSPIVYHRDLKSANILIDEKFNAKLGDFGLSFIYMNNNNVFNLTGGTPGYADPYYISTHEINEQTEIYSFGALILEMLVSKSPAIHVGKNYNCIYNTNEKCPIFCHRKKSENDDNVFDYLVNHINMNDYKSIYSILDQSVNFPDFLVEKLTKLSFLCLNPNIKNRPSSKLVNLILLEIQKESECFIKKQQELTQKKINFSNMYFEECEKDDNSASVMMESSGVVKDREKKSRNTDLYKKLCINEKKKQKNKNEEYERKAKNYDNYVRKMEEINYDNVKQLFLKFMRSLFGGGQNNKLDENTYKEWEQILNKEFYKNFFKTFLSEFSQRSRYVETTNGHECNNAQPMYYTCFKHNTVGNLTNIKNVFFDNLHKDIFFKSYLFNSFSFNLMNSHFLRFLHEYLKNSANNTPASNNSARVKVESVYKWSRKVEINKWFSVDSSFGCQLGNDSIKRSLPSDMNNCVPLKDANFCDPNEPSKTGKVANCGLSKTADNEGMKSPFNIKRHVQMTPNELDDNSADPFGKDIHESNESSKNGNSSSIGNGNNGSCGKGNFPDIMLVESKNCKIRNKNEKDDSDMFMKHVMAQEWYAPNKKHNYYSSSSVDIFKNGSCHEWGRRDHIGMAPMKQSRPITIMHRYNGQKKHNNIDNININNVNTNKNMCSDNPYQNMQNSTDYEKGNKFRPINNPVKDINSQHLYRNNGYNQVLNEKNGYPNCQDAISLYNIDRVQNENNVQNNFNSNKWSLKRNCRDNTPKMVFNIPHHDHVKTEEQCLINKKKVMRTNVSIDEGKVAKNLGFSRARPVPVWIDINVGSKIGTNVGSNIGTNVGSIVGSNIGSNVESNIGSNVESIVGSKVVNNIESNVESNIRSNRSCNPNCDIRLDNGTTGSSAWANHGMKNGNTAGKAIIRGTAEKNTSPQKREIQECNIIYISNFANYINFDRNRNGVDSNTFEWFHKNVFEMIIDENRVTSDVTFLDILYEFNIFSFKKNNIPSYQSSHIHPSLQEEEKNKYTLSGKWSNCSSTENNFSSVNLQSNFFFEIAVHYDNIKKAHTIFLLRPNESKNDVCKEKGIVTKKIWVSDYVGRRNEFVEKILKKSISNILYECISRKHCLFILEVQMKQLSKPTSSDNNIIREGFSYYFFEYSLRVVCNSDNCIFSNNYILYKNNTYSYSLPNNVLSLLVFSEDKIMKGISPNKNSLSTTQKIHFPLYPFSVNINIYSEK